MPRFEKRTTAKRRSYVLPFFVAFALVVPSVLTLRNDTKNLRFFSGELTASMEIEKEQAQSLTKNQTQSGTHARNSSETTTSFQINTSDPRPWMIFHVGPPKTASTTIQEGLKEQSLKLAIQDNLYFLGHAQNYRANVTLSNNQTLITYRLPEILWYHSKPFRQDLESKRQRRANVVLSLEQFTPAEVNFGESYYEYFLLPFQPDREPKPRASYLDATTIQSHSIVESQFGYKVRVVVGYRHFFEHLVSSYHESYKHLEPNAREDHRPGIVDFCNRYLDRLKQYDPQNTNTTTIYTTSNLKGRGGFDKYKQHTLIAKETSHYSVFSYLKWSSQPELYDRVDILDLHQQPLAPNTSAAKERADNETTQQRDVFGDFVCHHLPLAVHTCSHLQNEAKKNKVIVARKRSQTKSLSFRSMTDHYRIMVRLKNNHELPIKEEAARMKEEAEREKRIVPWFQKQGLLWRRGATPIAEDGGPLPANVTALGEELTTCLDSDGLARVKTASWNSLLQMVLLTKAHAKSRGQRQPEQGNNETEAKTYDSDHDYASLFQSTVSTAHLLLSPQAIWTRTAIPIWMPSMTMLGGYPPKKPTMPPLRSLQRKDTIVH